MDILKKLMFFAKNTPNVVAIKAKDYSITYKELDEYSNRLANYIMTNYKDDKVPLVVYGHKSAYMIVCFIACAKSNRAYCPIDISVPDTRTKDIIEMVNPPVILALEPIEGYDNILGLDEIIQISHNNQPLNDTKTYNLGEDVFYIIFTSGSTGKPKGVQITTDCLNNYLEWSVTLGSTYKDKVGKVFLNQAPFSFDLSVMDLYTCLACGGTLVTMDKNVQMDYKDLIDFLGKSSANIWVSTPSFADVCLSDKKFSDELLPNLEVFLFCGETLTNNTVKKLHQRFEKATVINTYGPTESTVAMTDVVVDQDMVENISPLPVGKVKPGTFVDIVNENGEIVPEGEKGEIIIIGNTVSCGYYKKPDLTEKAFFSCEKEGQTYRAYRTGDAGYMQNGQLFYCGRIDLQIKLHGYRIEIEDIENNIVKLPEVSNVVVVPKMKDNKVRSLTAFVSGNRDKLDSKDAIEKVKEDLKSFVPDYMVPKKFIYIDKIPMTNNGKADRKYLGGLI